MNLTSSPRFLPTVLWLDAASCLATGLLQLAAPAALSAWFGLPAALLATSGWMLLAVAAFARYRGTAQLEGAAAPRATAPVVARAARRPAA